MINVHEGKLFLRQYQHLIKGDGLCTYHMESVI
jgi:hypothetical protein